MEKTFFEKFAELNKQDIQNGTSKISLCSRLISADCKAGQGTVISMGTSQDVGLDIADGKLIPLMLLIDKEAFHKLQ